MRVCIAEKPSVAKGIAQVLGATTPHEGYMEGNGYQVTWTFGHLCTLKSPDDYTPFWKAWALSSLPMIPARFGIKLIEDKGVKKQFDIIQRLMRKADEIINCGDAGQEGELIQRWVMQKAGATCPVRRLWISSLTEEAIEEGFKALQPQNDFQALYEAGLSRAIGDWLLGMNATRLYTLKYGQNRQVLSIGRVQTPTLALIVKRQEEIDHFKPEPYWVLTTLYRDTLFTAAKGKFEKEEEGTSALEQIKGKDFTITDITKKKGQEAPPRLFDLTSLQVECNKKYGYSADITLKLIQSLYEKKFTTYPRVDTTYLTDDIYPKCPSILQGIRERYGAFTDPLAGKKLPKSKKVFDNSKVTDHHAIIPTGQPPRNLTEMERNVMDMIAARFIAVFYPNCVYATTTVMGEVDKVKFKATGKQILEAGWRVLYPSKQNAKQDNAEEQGENKILPDFTKGESGPHEPKLTQKFTQPPKPYTEATLLRAMETAGKLVEDETLREAMKENGIGRPSTRAAIIETLYKRHYMRKVKKNLFPTPTGTELIGLINEELLKSAELTGRWEKKLREIERRQYKAADFIAELKQMVGEIVQHVMADTSNRHVAITVEPEKKEKTKRKTTRKSTAKASPKKTEKKELKPDDSLIGKPCPVCGKGHIIKGKTAYGCSEWKNGCTFRLPFTA